MRNFLTDIIMQRFPAPMVPSVMAHPIYRPIPPSPPASSRKSTSSQVPDAHPVSSLILIQIVVLYFY